jgi:hypothetical protein
MSKASSGSILEQGNKTDEEVIVQPLAKAMLAALMGIAFSLSMVSAGYPPFSGFLDSPNVYSKLTPGPKGGAKLRWVKPGTDFKKYNKFMGDNVIFYLSDKSENKGIDPQEM